MRVANVITNFKKRLVGTLIMMEERESIFVRRVRILLDQPKFYIAVDKVRNKWAADQLSEEREKESLDRLKRWIESSFAYMWMNARLEKVFFELDIKNGGARFRIRDYGLKTLPARPIFQEVATKTGRVPTQSEFIGDLYTDPELWIDTERDEQDYTPLGSIVEDLKLRGLLEGLLNHPH